MPVAVGEVEAPVRDRLHGRSDIQLRIVGNSASGSFNRGWIDMQEIGSALEKRPRGASITSDILGPLFRGKSVNNQLFLFAVLKHEGSCGVWTRRSGGTSAQSPASS